MNQQQHPSAVKAVIELGFPKRLAQTSYRAGMRASDLIDFLEDNFVDLEEEERALEEKFWAEKECQRKEEAKQDRKKLMNETSRLYFNAMCARCHDNKRSHVLLPCSHFALCNFCVTSQTNCPLCQEGIEMIIHTFF